MNTNHLSGKIVGRVVKAVSNDDFKAVKRFYGTIRINTWTLYEWVALLRKDGINSKQIVLDQIENILKGNN